MGINYSEGPFDKATVCSLAYILQEGLMLAHHPRIDDKIKDFFEVSSSFAFGDGIISLVTQIGLEAKINPKYLIEKVIQSGIDRAKGLIDEDIERNTTRLKQKIELLGERDKHSLPYDEEIYLKKCQDEMKGHLKAVKMLAELKRFPWDKFNLPV